MCNLVCRTMSRAKLLPHWSVIHYHVTFEWHSGHGLERCNAFYAIIIANTFL